ncbi:MAG: 30S ribosomal protein S3 [Deltaproteobacteria bacterium RBG_19FT_COMBO_52_11]|nr:MAG: 30S ribosomal protein S3 [Deltaproteobacteria bacterium RBG_19FT_COMBO_52_11]
MGQKVNPIGLRLGIVKTWDSRWYAEKLYSKFLQEDIIIRRYIKKKLYHAGVSKVEIERTANRAKITIRAARPGIIIGQKGAEIEKLQKEIRKMTQREISINIQEVRRVEADAQLVAENVALQLERRVAFRRAMKKSVTASMKFGVQGIKIACGGRLGGAEIARSEWYREGRVPLHTLRADIDYGFAEARTTYGAIGIKVWIYKGEVLPTTRGRKETIQ